MPVTKSAIKKLRQDKKREEVRDVFERTVRIALRKAQKEKSLDTVKSAVSLIDKAVKKHIYHSNKAGRLKSSLAKLLPRDDAPKATSVKPVTKKATTVKKNTKTRAQTATK
jgi:small subunit ribosomal protein S20